ncbi:hypothetical protein BDR04DRAFT_1021225, partial [Suillus decipiens]
TGMEGFYIAVHGGIEDLSEPKVFFTQKVEKFIKDILHMEPWHLGLKLESYVISGLGLFVCSLINVLKCEYSCCR